MPENRDDEAKQIILDYKYVFETDEGKRVLEHLKKKANFHVSIVPKDNVGRLDVNELVRREGQRSVIIHIDSMLKKDPNIKRFGKPKLIY